MELFESNFDPKTVTLNENGLIEDALNWKAKYYSPIGKTSQDSYTGKNQFNINAEKTVFNPSVYKYEYNLEPNKQYTISSNCPNSTVANLYANSTSSSDKVYIDSPRTITSDNDGYFYVLVRYAIPDASPEGAVNLYEGVLNGTYWIQIEQNSTATDYEPYVGNQPSPNPDFQQPIENVTGDVKTETNNINFFDSKLLAQEPDYNTYDKSTGLWTTSSIGAYFRSILYKVSGAGTIKDVSKLVKLKAGNYTIKFFDFYATSSANNAISILLIDKDGNKISIIQSSISNKDTIPITLEEDYYIDIARTDSTGTLSFSNIMIVEGTYTTNTFPSFVEHQGKSITFPLSQGQKMYEGDYLSDDGIHHVRGQLVLNGSENIEAAPNYNTADYYCYKLYIANLKPSQSQVELDTLKCTHLNQITWYRMYSSKTNELGCSTSLNSAYIYFKVPFATVEDFKAWLLTQYNNNAPMIIEYELAQEVIDPYTSEQQTAWEELKQLETYKGQTHIYTSSDGLSPDSKVTYLVNPLIERDSRLDALEQAVVALNSNN